MEKDERDPLGGNEVDGASSNDLGGGSLGEEEGESNLQAAVIRSEQFFKEATQLSERLKKTLEGTNAFSNPEETLNLFERTSKTISQYQEQPQLVSRRLYDFLPPILVFSRSIFETSSTFEIPSSSTSKQLLEASFQLLYVFAKVCRPKTIFNYFPHDVGILEPLIRLMETYETSLVDPTKQSWSWHTAYIVSLWLSVVALLPFELSSFDSVPTSSSSSSSTSQSFGIIDRMLTASKRQLCDTGKTQEAAAFLIAQLLTRSDLSRSHYSTDFIAWCTLKLQETSDPTNGVFIKVGILSTLCVLFQKCRRELWVDKVPTVLRLTLQFITSNTNSSVLLRKLGVKLIQRLGLVFLPRKAPTWIYRRQNRSLTENLARGREGFNSTTVAIVKANETDKQEAKEEEEEEEEEEELASEIEEIIGVLLNGLKDRDTVVRWSAAKGLGRISLRFPSISFADDIIPHLLKLLDTDAVDVNEFTCHGACLTLAEMARSGVLSPKWLPSVVPIVMKALVYDERKGKASVGANVRDAACYVCWSFARSYTPEVLAPYVHQIAVGLVIESVYDREVNCRRAASAAFQENVGRQGNFPHGIEILTIADYFSIAIRNHSYLDISLQIAKLDNYRQPMILHLLETKVGHWDKSLRELTSQTLAQLTSLDPIFMIEMVLPSLCKLAFDSDVTVRHGSVLALAEITLELVNSSHFTSETHSTVPELKRRIVSLIGDLEKAKLYKGKGSELIRLAASRLIQVIALSNFSLVPLPKEAATSSGVTASTAKKGPPAKFLARASASVSDNPAVFLQEVLDDNIKHPNEEIQVAAAEALAAFSFAYHSTTEPGSSKSSGQKLLEEYINTLGNELSAPGARRGACLGLGALSLAVILPSTVEVMKALATAAKIEPKVELRDAETRRNAVRALWQVVERLGIQWILSNPEMLNLVFSTFSLGMEDYSLERRGDVGSWVREASIKATGSFVPFVLSQFEQINTNLQGTSTEQTRRLFCQIVRQATEHIDRVREPAGNCFFQLINDERIPDTCIPHREDLKSIFKGVINWVASTETFPLFVKLLKFSDLRTSVMSGCVMCIGGLTKSLIYDAGNAVTDYVASLSSKGEVAGVANTLLEVAKVNEKNDRVMVPYLKAVQFFLQRGLFATLQPPENQFSLQLIEVTKNEARGSKDVVKLITVVQIWCLLMGFGAPTPFLCCQLLLALLCNIYPRVRKATAEHFYVALQTFQIAPNSSNQETAIQLLMETQWDASDETVYKPVRTKLCELLEVPLPTPPARQPTPGSK